MRGVIRRYRGESGVEYFAAACKGGDWRMYKQIPGVGVRLAMGDYLNEREVLDRLKNLARKLNLIRVTPTVCD